VPFEPRPGETPEGGEVAERLRYRESIRETTDGRQKKRNKDGGSTY
jgi:hypothetical protein